MTNNTQEQERRGSGFVIGLMAGTCVGAGLAMWLAPRAAAEIRKRMTASANDLCERTSAQVQAATAGVTSVVDELARKGQDVRDDVAVSVARGAHEVAREAHAVERFAMGTTSGRRS